MSSSSNNNHKKSVLDDKNKVTAQSYGNIQDSQTGKEAWMLRLPNKLAEAFDRAPEGTVLGELVFRKGGGKNSSIKPVLDIHVSPDVGVDPSVSATASAASSSLPLHYSLVMTKDVPTLHPFSRYANGSVKLHGTVTRSGNMQVYQDKNYRALLKDRILETSVNKKSYVKQVDANQVVQQTAARGSMADPSGKKGGFGEAVSVLGKRILEANERQQAGAAGTSADGKRMRFSDDMETKTIVFQLYEQKPFWTTKDLRLHSGRSESEIKDVLKEIATYERSGENKNSWGLKKEYQVTKKSSAQSGGDGSSSRLDGSPSG